MIKEPIRILMVEDDDAVRKVLRDVLNGIGYQVEVNEAPDKASAKQFLLTKECDCILLDLKLRNGEGKALIKEILEARTDLIPMVVITGFEERDTEISTYENGVQEFLPKTAVTPKTLRRVIENSISRVAGIGRLIEQRATRTYQLMCEEGRVR